MGKGDKRRPREVPDKEWDDNIKEAFSKTCQHKWIDDRCCKCGTPKEEMNEKK